MVLAQWLIEALRSHGELALLPSLGIGYSLGKLHLGSFKVGPVLGGLVAGWLRSVSRRFGRVPEPALWLFDSVGLNAFLALVGNVLLALWGTIVVLLMAG